MYTYYERQEILPTFADFRDPAQLDAYEEARRRLFLEKLCIPPHSFESADVLQYGPDSGEDALVFARWGGKLTLVEPNARAHPAIREYFRRFGLEPRLTALEHESLQSYAPQRRFDFIDAEGFIWTVRPTSLWLSQFSEQLKDDGLFFISYNEMTGIFVELCTRALFRAGEALRSGVPALDTASAMFAAKWDSIPHTRSFASWVMDVLENPFVRRNYCLRADELCGEAARHGFELYSSWPTYHDPLDIYWHRMIPDSAALRRRSAEHIARSALSFLFGEKLYVVEDGTAPVVALGERLDRLGLCVDALTEEYDAAGCLRAVDELAAVEDALAGLATFGTAGRRNGLALLASLRAAFAFAARADFTGLARFLSGDPAFIRSWGQPYHLAAFRRVPR